jgi:CRP-like cAMP-binding protein
MSNAIINESDIIIPQGHCLIPEELEEIRRNSNVVAHMHRELIFRQNTRTSHIMFIRSGLVKVFKEGKNRRSFILKIAKPGEYLGLLSIFGSEMHQFSASAIQTCEIAYVDFSVFSRILRKNCTFAMNLVNTLSMDGLFIFDKMLGQSHKQLPGRVADVILYFSESIFGSGEFEFPLTRRELAELAGTTKESFIRTLAEFKHDKIIQLEGSKVSINSLKIIHTLSELG